MLDKFISPGAKLIILAYLIYHFSSFLQGIITFIVAHRLIIFVIEIAFDMDCMNSLDKMFLIEYKNNQNVIITALLTERLEERQMHLILDKLLSVRRMRQSVRKFLGDTFWCENKNTKNFYSDHVEQISAKVTSEEDIHNFISKEFSVPLDMTKPLWKIYYFEQYKEDTSLCIFKYHHAIGDGIALVNLFSSICQDLDLSTYKCTSIKPISFWHKIILFLFSPYYMFKSLPPSPEKNFVNPLERFSMAGKNITSKAKSVSITKSYDFEIFKKVYKQYPGATFNDLSCSLICKALARWYCSVNNNVNSCSMIAALGVSGRTGIEKQDMGNEAGGRLIHVNINPDISMDELITKMIEINSKVKNKNAIISCLLLFKVIGNYTLNGDLMVKYGDSSFRKVTFIYTNVQGPSSCVHLSTSPSLGAKVKDILAFVPHGSLPFSVLSFTYNGKVRYSMTAESNFGTPIAELIKFLEDEINKLNN